MTAEKKSAKTPTPDPAEALKELGEAIDEMEAGVKDRARETLCSMSPGLKVGLAIGALALGAAGVLFALKRGAAAGDEHAEAGEGKEVSTRVRDATAEAVGKAIKAGFAALADRVEAREKTQS
ncbi:MAG: hypothetical protein ACLFWB_12655 [Armatimonadota bacterium]